jgi:PilZ domain
MADEAKRGRGLLQRLKGALGDEDHRKSPERRASKRVALPIPVRLRIGDGESATRRLKDLNQQGFCVEAAAGGVPGERVVVRFEGYPDVCETFFLRGRIVRLTDETPSGLVVQIDRAETAAAAIEQYRALVLHYIRHRPLLDEVGKGYFEGRCQSCDWIGRVGAKKPTCPKCGGRVAPVAE